MYVHFSRRPDWIGTNNLAISGDHSDDWFIGWCPDSDSLAAEGTWDAWVSLAKAILDVESRRPSSR